MTAETFRSVGAIMRDTAKARIHVMSWVLALALLAITAPIARAAQAPAANAGRQVVGAVKAVRGTTITVAPDTGAEVNIDVRPSVRVLRIAPGETNLAKATPIQFSDIQVGDRVLVAASAGADAQTMTASRVIVMKKTDVDAKQEADRQDWQRRGIAGLVSNVAPDTGVITVSANGPAGSRSIAVHTTTSTKVRRYAPDSVRFDDAIPSPVAQIKAGDQLRARGTRNADGDSLNAEEVVVGSFRNISGKISSIDSSANTLTVDDLATKKPVVIKVSPQSQVTKLTPEAAQAFEARARTAGGGGGRGGAAGPPTGQGGPANAGAEAGGGRGQGGGGRGGAGDAAAGGAGRGAAGGQADLQQVISRMPPATLSSFNKGDAVMVVSTEGTATGGVTAITLVGGVEPILTAPNGAQQTLAPWDLGGGGGGDGGGGQ